MAAAAAQHLNPDLRVTAFTHPLHAATEDVFGDHFFSHVDGVAAALDSFQARECSPLELSLLPWAVPAPVLMLYLPYQGTMWLPAAPTT